jgi:plastocyanin
MNIIKKHTRSSAEQIGHRCASSSGITTIPFRLLPRKLCLLGAVLILVLATITAPAATVEVQAGSAGFGPGFYPPYVMIKPGDTVRWVWANAPISYSVTSGSNRMHDGLFDSGIHKAPYSFSYTFGSAGRYEYFTRTIAANDQGQPIVGVVEVVAAQPLNISTRVRVQTGENVMIGGFIITGGESKKVIIRALGPSLQQAGLIDALTDPLLELRSSDGALLRSNDNWKESQQTEIQSTGIPPPNDAEAAIVVPLPPNAYTAIVRGKNGGTGAALVEVYDLASATYSRLANISTRGLVQAADNVMIGGFILGNGDGMAKVIVRAIGPSLAQAGISGALADPTLELRDRNGAVVQSNNNWKESQQAEIQATGVAPQNELESAIITSLPADSYTAIVAGKDGGVGVGLVEVYQLQ